MKNKKKKQKLDKKYNLGMYFSLIKKYKLMFVLLLVITLLVEASYVADKFLFKAIIDKGSEFAAGSLVKNSFVTILLTIAAVFICLIVLRAVFKWLFLHYINRIEVNVILDMKRKFFNHLISLSHSFHTSHKTGSLISRLIRGGGAIERRSDAIFFNFAPLIFQLIIAAASLIYFDYISAIVVASTVIVFLAYNLFFQTIQQDANLAANDTEDIEKANISDIFTNVDSIKYFGKENAIKSKFLKLIEATRKAYLKNWDYFRFLDAGESLILSLGTLLLLYFPIVKFLNGGITIGSVVFIYTIYVGLIGSMFGFVHGIRSYYRSMADFDDLFQYAKIENEIKDKLNAEELKIKEGEIEFENVSFSYGNRKIFTNLNLKIPKNKKMALVGHSGSGKTTLVKLLYRFYDVNSGKILIDGKDLRDFKQESLRSEMSIVPQECVLFDDSVYNNVAFSNPKASRKEVMQAMKFAQLDKTISNFPKKERTIVGERGVKLSGGEKQRVSIARAILANRKILVLDEATSSLDSETEHEIQADLARLIEGRTTIIIAHRLSTIMNADRIIVFKNGKIVQQGRHNELIRQAGEYKHLWSLQKGGYIK